MSRNKENSEITDTTVENQVNNSSESIECDNLEIDGVPFVVDGEVNDEYSTLTMDELREMLDEDREEETFKLDTDNLCETEIDQKLFAKGVKSVSELCGKFSALVSVGFSHEDAASLLISRETAQHNIDIAKIQDTQTKFNNETNSI